MVGGQSLHDVSEDDASTAHAAHGAGGTHLDHVCGGRLCSLDHIAFLGLGGCLCIGLRFGYGCCLFHKILIKGCSHPRESSQRIVVKRGGLGVALRDRSPVAVLDVVASIELEVVHAAVCLLRVEPGRLQIGLFAHDYHQGFDTFAASHEEPGSGINPWHDNVFDLAVVRVDVAVAGASGLVV